MGENNFKGTVESLFKGMEGFITSKTVVGDAVKFDDGTIIKSQSADVLSLNNGLFNNLFDIFHADFRIQPTFRVDANHWPVVA